MDSAHLAQVASPARTFRFFGSPEIGPDVRVLVTTQRYLADVRKAGDAKKAVADADFVPKPKVLKTGTDGD